MNDRPNHPPHPTPHAPDDDEDDDDRDDIPDVPGTEPEPVPIKDPKPDGQPSGPLIAR